MTRKTVLIDQHQVAVRVGQGNAGGACRCFVGVAQDQPVLGGITTDHGKAELLAKGKQWADGHGLGAASGCVPVELPCFETWQGRPFAHGNAYFERDLWLPVRSA